MPVVQPCLIKCSNEFVSRVVYIDYNGSNDRSNIRKSLTTEMKKLDWYPKDKFTTFIFFKRNDTAGWKPEEEVEKAIHLTREAHKQVKPDFQFAILKPVSLCGIDDNVPDFTNLFANIPINE